MAQDEQQHPAGPRNIPVPSTAQAMVPYSYANDEINLVDVGVSLWRRWKLMLVVFLVCVGLGLTLAIVRRKSYDYTAVIRLGSYSRRNGTSVAVVTPESALAALNRGFINLAVQMYATSHKIAPRRIKIRALGSRSTRFALNDTIILLGKGPLRLENAYKAIEKSAAQLLAQSTGKQINVVRANFQQRLTDAQLKLGRIEDLQEVKIAKSVLQENVAAAKARLERLKERHAVLKDKFGRLQDAEQLYKRQEQQFNRYLDRARKADLAASNANSPTQAMTAMLLNNQIQRNLQQLNNIEEKITVTLPQEIATVQADLANTKQQQIVKQNTLEQAEAKLANYDAEHQRAIASQKAAIANLKAQIDNIQPTQLIVRPSRSIRPAGPRRAIIAILAAAFGVILALFAAGIANYFSAVRSSLGSSERKTTA